MEGPGHEARVVEGVAKGDKRGLKGETAGDSFSGILKDQIPRKLEEQKTEPGKETLLKGKQKKGGGKKQIQLVLVGGDSKAAGTWLQGYLRPRGSTRKKIKGTDTVPLAFMSNKKTGALFPTKGPLRDHYRVE